MKTITLMLPGEPVLVAGVIDDAIFVSTPLRDSVLLKVVGAIAMTAMDHGVTREQIIAELTQPYAKLVDTVILPPVEETAVAVEVDVDPNKVN